MPYVNARSRHPDIGHTYRGRCVSYRMEDREEALCKYNQRRFLRLLSACVPPHFFVRWSRFIDEDMDEKRSRKMQCFNQYLFLLSLRAERDQESWV